MNKIGTLVRFGAAGWTNTASPGHRNLGVPVFFWITVFSSVFFPKFIFVSLAHTVPVAITPERKSNPRPEKEAEGRRRPRFWPERHE